MFYRLKKRGKRVLNVFLKLPAEKAITTPVLAQVIGQYGFNIQEFLLTYNKKSNIFMEGIQVQTILYILQNKKWKLAFGMPITIQSIKRITNLNICSKYTRISYFLKRKWIRNKLRYKIIQYKYWRGKITLRHIYNLITYFHRFSNITNNYTNLVGISNHLKAAGIYIAKIAY